MAGGGYDAFISYSHRGDLDAASVVRLGLERLARPWTKRRALKVFQDRSGLATSPDLWESITVALDSSQYFVLLASPESAGSEWVGREVERFLESHPPTHLLVCLTAGEILWDSAAGDFDWQRTTALPPALRGAFAAEPLWADLRWMRTDLTTDMRDPRLGAAIADLAAPIHGVPKDELFTTDLREYRKAKRLRRMAVGALAILTVIAVVASTLAVRSREQAETNLEVADARRLAAESGKAVDVQDDLSLLLAAESLRARDTHEGWDALADAITVPVAMRRYGASTDLLSVAVDPSGELVAGGDAGGTVHVWNARTGELVQEIEVSDSVLGDSQEEPAPGSFVYHALTELRFTEDRVLVGLDFSQQIFTWDPSSGELLGMVPGPDIGRLVDYVTALSPTGAYALRTETTEADPKERFQAVLRTRDGSVVDRRPDITPLGLHKWVSDDVLLEQDSNGAKRLFDAGTGTPLTPALEGIDETVTAAAGTSDGSLVATVGFDGVVRIWDAATGTQVDSRDLAQGRLFAVAVDPTGDIVLTMTDRGTVDIWHPTTD
ncbi:MAG TPA: toll/interleukin-1 receptor domain-containing protein, partial [Acidimicrobiales bacterium]